MRSTHVVLVPLLLLGSVLAMAGLAGCWIVERDYYQCGIAVDGVVRRCDGVGEICLCQENRCAVSSSACESGFRYRFGQREPPDCVSKEKLEPQVRPDSPRPYCPGEGELPIICGGQASDGGFVACPAGQYCVCATQQCAILDKACGEDGGTPLRYVSLTNSSCAGNLGTNLPDLVARSDNSCPGLRPSDYFPDAGGGSSGPDGGSSSPDGGSSPGSDGGNP